MDRDIYCLFVKVYLMENHEDPHSIFAAASDLERQEAKLTALKISYELYTKLKDRYED
jgi:hypothetical protein